MKQFIAPLSFISKTKQWDKAFFVLALVCLVATGGLLAFENFIFSSKLGLLGFREIDDLAFQVTLRKCHLLLQAGQFNFLTATYDYAYGWIFWIPLAVVTYPLFWLSQLTSIDWPLIVFPRLYSLAAGLGAIYFIDKTLQLFKTSFWGRGFALLFLVLFPSFGYFSMRFGTVNLIFFFSALSVYLAAKDSPSTDKGRLYVALSVAAACSVKPSGLFIAPVAAWLVWNRLSVKTPRDLVRQLTKPVLVFCSAAITLSCPRLWASIFNPSIAQKYFETLHQFMVVPQTSYGEALGNRIYSGIFLASDAFVGLVFILSASFILLGLRQKESRKDILGILGGISLILAYLVATIKASGAIAVYLSPVFFLFLIGIEGLAQNKLGRLLMLLIVGGLVYENVDRSVIYNRTNPLRWGMTSYFIKEIVETPGIRVAEQVLDCINKDRGTRPLTHIFVDFTIPLTINPVNSPDTCISVAWNNLSPERVYCGKPVDYLVLDREGAVGTLSEQAFAEKLKNIDNNAAQFYKEDRATRSPLYKKGTFGKQHFSLLCQAGKADVFKADLP